MATAPVQTLVIDNFQGRLTRYLEGDINSGFGKYNTTFGNDPFTTPRNLTWFERPIRINPDASVITDLIVAQRPRLESGITYVYAVGSTGRVYKIQVNDPSTYNPNYDNPVLLTTLTIESPTFKYGSSIQFYGATEKVYIGHDKGVSSINFDGTGEAFVGVVGSWTQNVPRMSLNFTGITYWTNGTNIAAIDSTATVTSYARLTPGFPVGTQARDIDVSSDGNYVQIVVSRVPQSDLTVSTQDTTSLSSGDSYFIQWNGTDEGYTAYNPFNSYSINANLSFGQNAYFMGYDLGGAAIYAGSQKIVSLPNSNCPTPQALYSIGNLLGFSAPEQLEGSLRGSLLAYGQYDEEIPPGLFRFFRQDATGISEEGPDLPTVGANDSSVGTQAWVNPGNITLNDGSYATASYASLSSVSDNRVSIVRSNGTVGTTNKAVSGQWPTTDTTQVYGGPSDLWGESWTAADINSANFGAVLSINVGDDVTNYLKGTGYGFSIPANSTIRGIELTINRKRTIVGFGVTAYVDSFTISVYYVDPAAELNTIQVPSCQVVSNLLYGASNSGYTNSQVGSAKVYFSTFEVNSSGLDQYKLYKFTTVPTGSGTAIEGVYETQNQIFSKKVKIGDVRIYTEPLAANNSFQIDLIGSGNTPIPGATKIFTVGDNAQIGQDYAWYTPQCAPTYCIGVRITNLGTVNMVFSKVEIDYSIGGQ